MTFGKKLSFNGSKRIISGLPLGNKLKPVTVTFKKTGTFTYYCNIHAGMKGKVTVKDKGKSIPSAKADKKALARQVATAIATSKKLAEDAGAGRTRSTSAPPASTARSCSPSCPSALTVPVGHVADLPDAPGVVRHPHGDHRAREPGDRSQLLPRPAREEVRGGAGARRGRPSTAASRPAPGGR